MKEKPVPSKNFMYNPLVAIVLDRSLEEAKFAFEDLKNFNESVKAVGIVLRKVNTTKTIYGKIHQVGLQEREMGSKEHGNDAALSYSSDNDSEIKEEAKGDGATRIKFENVYTDTFFPFKQ